MYHWQKHTLTIFNKELGKTEAPDPEKETKDESEEKTQFNRELGNYSNDILLV